MAFSGGFYTKTRGPHFVVIQMPEADEQAL